MDLAQPNSSQDDRLEKLKNDGIISEEEYATLKARDATANSQDQKQFAGKPQSYSVKDVKQILIWLGITLGAGYFSWLQIPDRAYAIAIIVPIFPLLRLKAVIGGVTFREDDTMSFPGGGVAPNGIIHFFSPSFLLQFFLRFRVELSEIRQIAGGKTYSWGKYTEKWNAQPYLRIVGSFGAAKIKFSNIGKRDEAYQHIRVTNGMGTPIFMA